MSLIGVIDESAPMDGHGNVIYALAAAVLDQATAAAVQWRLPALLNRKRPLHWESEGALTRTKIMAEICEISVAGHVASVMVQPKHQQSARTTLLEDRLLPLMSADGVDNLLVERRSMAEDNRDRQIIRSWFRSSRYEFLGIEHVAKDEPLAWVSDALAGAWTDAVLDRGGGFIEPLVGSGTLRSSWQSRE